MFILSLLYPIFIQPLILSCFYHILCTKRAIKFLKDQTYFSPQDKLNAANLNEYWIVSVIREWRTSTRCWVNHGLDLPKAMSVNSTTIQPMQNDKLLLYLFCIAHMYMRKRDMFSPRWCSCEKARHAVSQTTLTVQQETRKTFQGKCLMLKFEYYKI